MTGTDPNDDWADLSRELGVDESATPPARPARRDEPAARGDDGDEAEVVELTTAADGDDEGDGFASGLDDEAEGGPDDADGEAGEATETGEDGEPRKKRRRRRRRKKGKGAEAGQPAAPGAAGFAEPGSGNAETEPEGDDDGPGEFAGGDFEEDAAPAATGAEDEGVSPEAARELIANWNVPSWDQIVAGLYRPG